MRQQLRDAQLVMVSLRQKLSTLEDAQANRPADAAIPSPSQIGQLEIQLAESQKTAELAEQQVVVLIEQLAVNAKESSELENQLIEAHAALESTQQQQETNTQLVAVSAKESSELKSQLFDAQATVSNAQEQIGNLTEQLSDHLSSNAERYCELEDLAVKLAAALQRVSELESRLVNMSSAAAEKERLSETAAVGLEEEASKLRGELEASEGLMKDQCNEITEWSAAVEKSTAENHMLQNELFDVSSELMGLRADFAALEIASSGVASTAELAQQQAAYLSTQEERWELESRLAEAEAAAEFAEPQAAALERFAQKNGDLELQVSQLEQAVESAHHQIAVLTDQLAAGTKENKELKNQLTGAQAAVQSAQQQRELLQSQLTEVQAEASALTEQLSSSTEENGKLQSQLTVVQTEASALTEQLSSSTNKIQELETQLTAANRTMNSAHLSVDVDPLPNHDPLDKAFEAQHQQPSEPARDPLDRAFEEQHAQKQMDKLRSMLSQAEIKLLERDQQVQDLTGQIGTHELQAPQSSTKLAASEQQDPKVAALILELAKEKQLHAETKKQTCHAVLAELKR